MNKIKSFLIALFGIAWLGLLLKAFLIPGGSFFLAMGLTAAIVLLFFQAATLIQSNIKNSIYLIILSIALPLICIGALSRFQYWEIWPSIINYSKISFALTIGGILVIFFDKRLLQDTSFKKAFKSTILLPFIFVLPFGILISSEWVLYHTLQLEMQQKGITYSYFRGEHVVSIAKLDYDIHNPQAKAYHQKATKLYKGNNLQEALNFYTKAIEIEPQKNLIFDRANCYMRLNNNELALHDLNEVIKVDSNHAYAYSQKGLILYTQNKNEEALAYYNKAIRILPNYAGFYFNRALAFEALNQNANACLDLKKALALNKALAERTSALIEKNCN